MGSVALDRAIALKGGLFDFVPLIWPRAEVTDFISNWHLGAVCEALEAVSLGYCKRLVINIPPGCSKSRLTGLVWPCWHWLNFPTDRFMFASFDGSLTLKQANDALEITSSDWWASRFSDIYTTNANQAGGEYENSKGGYRIATSVGGKATGKHVHIQVADDPTKPRDASKENLEKTIDWWKGTMSTRQADPTNFRRVIVMQRLHSLDLSEYAEQEGYEVLRLPMRYESKAFSKADIRTVEGELLWPERFPEEAVAQLERELGIHAPAQLQQRPVPEGGAIFNRDWLLKTYDILPHKNTTWIQSWDCAFKDDKTNDFVCGQVWLRTGGEFYLVDQVHAHLSFSATVQAIRDMSRKWPQALTKLVEDKANGSAVIDTLHKEIPGLVAVDPQGGKIARANAISGLFKAGNVYLPNTAWIQEYRNEFASFPKGAHDDMVDATSQALRYLYENEINLGKAMAGLEKLEQKQGVRRWVG